MVVGDHNVREKTRIVGETGTVGKTRYFVGETENSPAPKVPILLPMPLLQDHSLPFWPCPHTMSHALFPRLCQVYFFMSTHLYWACLFCTGHISVIHGHTRILVIAKTLTYPSEGTVEETCNCGIIETCGK